MSDMKSWIQLVESASKTKYTGRETKQGTWHVFQQGESVAAAGPFKSASEANQWIRSQETTNEAHGNSKIYDKCWDGYRKVPGKRRGEKGSCVKESDHQFSNGDRVKFTPEYDDGSGEVFTLKNWDGRRGWVVDDEGRGWSATGDQLIPVDDDYDEDDYDLEEGQYSDKMDAYIAKLEAKSKLTKQEQQKLQTMKDFRDQRKKKSTGLDENYSKKSTASLQKTYDKYKDKTMTPAMANEFKAIQRELKKREAMKGSELDEAGRVPLDTETRKKLDKARMSDFKKAAQLAKEIEKRRKQQELGEAKFNTTLTSAELTQMRKLAGLQENFGIMGQAPSETAGTANLTHREGDTTVNISVTSPDMSELVRLIQKYSQEEPPVETEVPDQASPCGVDISPEPMNPSGSTLGDMIRDRLTNLGSQRDPGKFSL